MPGLPPVRQPAFTDANTKKTPEEWADLIGYRIVDPDGWRSKGDPPFTQSLTWAEFVPRFNKSTVGPIQRRPSEVAASAASPEKRIAFCDFHVVGALKYMAADGPVNLRLVSVMGRDDHTCGCGQRAVWKMTEVLSG